MLPAYWPPTKYPEECEDQEPGDNDDTYIFHAPNPTQKEHTHIHVPAHTNTYVIRVICV